MSRVLLVSGKGGVGKTTVAAASAVRAAALGHRTLVVSLDRAHNLGQVLGVTLGPSPSAVPGVERLLAMEADPQAELVRQWSSLRGYLGQFLNWAGLGGVEADEIAVLPGLEELLVLSRLTELVEDGGADVVVVDLAPTASSLRMLSFPELVAGPLGRFARWERSFLKVTRPAMQKLTRAPVPGDDVYDAIDALAGRLSRLRALLCDPAQTTVRVVSIPERVVIDETRDAFTLLSLFGICVDAVVLNRVLPKEAEHGYFHAWTKIQARELARAKAQFEGVPQLRLAFQPDEVTGARALARVAKELYGKRDPAERFVDGAPITFDETKDGTRLSIALPHVDVTRLDLQQRDGELIISAGGWRRVLALPESLRDQTVGAAKYSGGALRVDFHTRHKKERR